MVNVEAHLLIFSFADHLHWNTSHHISELWLGSLSMIMSLLSLSLSLVISAFQVFVVFGKQSSLWSWRVSDVIGHYQFLYSESASILCSFLRYYKFLCSKSAPICVLLVFSISFIFLWFLSCLFHRSHWSLDPII